MDKSEGVMRELKEEGEEEIYGDPVFFHKFQTPFKPTILALILDN